LIEKRLLCGISVFSTRTDDPDVDKLREAPRGDKAMHDLLIALAFIGMVVAPAVVAAKSGAGAADELED
jgi:hypothetical protein